MFSDGSRVPCSPNDVLIIVGPNNSGKSACLRGIRDKVQDVAKSNPVIAQIGLGRSGSADDLFAWLGDWTFTDSERQPGNVFFQALGIGVFHSQAEHDWTYRQDALGALSRWFCKLLTTEERLQLANPAPAIPITHAAPSHPIHYLYRNDQLESKLSSKFRNAFSVDLILHRGAGSEAPLYVGEAPSIGDAEDRVSLSYVRRLETLSTLQSQGDGMRSFVGVLLATLVGRESVLLIDEPEAFLHPPQAHLLGSTLAHERADGRQLFLATHSADLLRGVLDSESRNVRVLRLTRQGSTNAVHVLDNAHIRELWADPLLRYSNILDGLFHECVVVCESDGDCRFFAAVYNSLHDSESESARRLDVMFTHCGGKARLPVVIRALKEVHVPVKAVADFDILSDEKPLREVVEALGLEWSEVEHDWKCVKGAIDSKKPELNTTEIAEEIHSVLDGITEPFFPKNAKDKIQSVLRRSSPWATAKSVGKAFVPSGDPSQACERLLKTLRSAGLHVVEVGELEGFARTIGGHGPKWVNEALQRDLHKDPELDSAREFVEQLLSTVALGE